MAKKRKRVRAGGKHRCSLACDGGLGMDEENTMILCRADGRIMVRPCNWMMGHVHWITVEGVRYFWDSPFVFVEHPKMGEGGEAYA